MKLFNVRQTVTGKWIICEGRETTGCAGKWETEAEAEGVAKLLNDVAEGAN